MQLTKSQVRQTWESDRKKEAKLLLLAILFTIGIFLLCISFRYNAYYFSAKFVPGAYLKSIGLFLREQMARPFGGSIYETQRQRIADMDPIIYTGALAQFKLIVMAFLSGGALALAGAVFQTIYKNPMASPNLLGATAGVNLGNIVMITLYSSAAVDLVVLRYKFCYGLTALCVTGVLLLGKLAGDRNGNPSVLNMVMAGSIISQGLGTFTMYYMYRLEDEDLLIYQQFNMGTYLQLDTVSMLIFLIIMIGSVLPVLLFRYRFNSVALDVTDAKTIGVNPMPIRFVGQICAVLMVTAAMIHCGQIGMISLVIPYLVRRFVGADFKKVCVYSLLIGGSILMLCRLLTSFILIADEPIPVTFIVNIVLTPLFMVILARRKEAAR